MRAMIEAHDSEMQAAVAAFLADPRTHGGQPVTRMDTHGAMVFLAGDRAYKMKRSVSFSYMDFSTLEKRKTICHKELRLNRRTAPELYLDVVPVTRTAEGVFALGGDGTIVEWVVVMKRVDQDAMLDQMAERGALTPDIILALADEIARFHKIVEPRPGEGATAAMRWVIDGNIEEMRTRPDLFATDRLDLLEKRSAAALARVADLIDRRSEAGYVRFCHGDLHLRNLCMIESEPDAVPHPVPFDCIEFNDSIAVIDVFYDLAFLLMDLEYRGFLDLANLVLNRYLDRTGDFDGLALLPLFLSVRAAVRSKIAAAISAGLSGAEADAKRHEAVTYLEAAITYLDPPAPALIAVGGLSGTGKTTLAQGLAPHLGAIPGAIVIRTDVLRKRLMKVDDTVRLGPEGYAPQVTRRVYRFLNRCAVRVLRAGHSAIVDGVFARPEERAEIEAAAKKAGAAFAGLWLQAPADTLIGRVEQRIGDASDATADVVQRQMDYEIGDLSWLIVDASGSSNRVREAVRTQLGETAASGSLRRDGD